MDNNILPTDEYVTFEDRAYLNPSLAVTETNQFIDNLRNTQQANNAQINQQTQRLGTDVPSDMGGLTGAQSYWTSRYQTPQTNSVVNDLRASAQASALNQALANEEAMWKKRYQEAYNAYQKRAWDKSGNSSDTDKGDISEENSTVDITDIMTDPIAKSRYMKILAKYLQAGYPTDEAEKRAKEDFGNSIDVDAPVDPYNGGN